MATKTSKSATKKSPVKKKAAVKKPVAKKAVAARKPVAKKAVAKKAVAKKVAARKPVAKKVAARKPVAKKAVAKKAVAKRAVVNNSTSTKLITAAPVNTWLNKEPELPVFLQNQSSEIKKDRVATQKYTQKSEKSVKFVLIAALVLLLGLGVNSFTSIFGSSSETNTATDSLVNPEATPSSSATGTAVDKSPNGSENTISPKPKPVTSSSSGSSSGTAGSASTSQNVSATEGAEGESSKVTTQSPRTFTSVKSDEGALLKWITPVNIGNVVAYELYARVYGQAGWVLMSTVTIEQLNIEVDLTPGNSYTEFKVASLLDNDKQVFNKTVITLPGSLS